MVDSLVVGDLEIRLVECSYEQIGFVYELMTHNIGQYFNSINEGWSRKKFKHGFDPTRITLLEHDEMPIGFYDCDITRDVAYLRGIYLSDDYCRIGIGTEAFKEIKRSISSMGFSSIKSKCFRENERSLSWAMKAGFDIDSEIPDEKSFLLIWRQHGE